MAYTPDNPYLPGDPYAYDLKWLVSEVKQLIADYQAQQTQISGIGDAQAQLAIDFQDLQDYVDNYFDNLDLTTEVNAILQQMYNDGYFNGIINNRNLLDNPFFSINQRGQASYSTNQGYTVDRWMLFSNSGTAVVTPNSNGITLDFGASGGDGIYQVVPFEQMENGKTYTLSAKMQDGTIESANFTYTAGGAAIIEYATHFRFHIVPTWGTGVLLGILNLSNAASTVNLRAVKLEMGTVSTLANDAPPNYSDELSRCKWYYRRYAIDGNRPIAAGVAAGATTARLILPMDTPMRIDIPTITTLGFNVIISSGATHVVSSIAAANATTGLLELSIETTGLTTFDPATWYTNGNEVIQISADL